MNKNRQAGTSFSEWDEEEQNFTHSMIDTNDSISSYKVQQYSKSK